MAIDRRRRGKPTFSESTVELLSSPPSSLTQATASPRKFRWPSFPEGIAGAQPERPAPRKDSTPDNVDSDYKPRSQVNCYPSSHLGGGRSLTVVRLDNGEIIRTFRRKAGDAPASLAARVIESDLDSPITGQPVAFPSDTARLLIESMSVTEMEPYGKPTFPQPIPQKWTMGLFFDAYPEDLGHDFDDGQPIATPPILSVDLTGNITIALSAGHQEVLTAPPGIRHYIWSLREEANSTGTALESKAQWYREFINGERVVGPISIFSEVTYFATFIPASTDTLACAVGSSRVWGMHYLKPEEDADLSEGGLARLPDPDSLSDFRQFISGNELTGSAGDVDNATIFGVTVAQQPSCEQTDSSSSNPYLAQGSHQAISKRSTRRL